MCCASASTYPVAVVTASSRSIVSADSCTVASCTAASVPRRVAQGEGEGKGNAEGDSDGKGKAEGDGDGDGDGEAKAEAEAEAECEAQGDIGDDGGCAGQGLTLSVGAGAAREVIRPRALLPLPLPATERDGAEDVWLTRPFAPRVSRPVTMGDEARALGGKIRRVSCDTVSRVSWTDEGTTCAPATA